MQHTYSTIHRTTYYQHSPTFLQNEFYHLKFYVEPDIVFQ